MNIRLKVDYSSHSSIRRIVIRIDLKKFSGSIWATKDRTVEKEKRPVFFFLETLSESIPPPKNKHDMQLVFVNILFLRLSSKRR